MSKRLYLSDFDLQQLDEQTLKELPAEQKDALLVKLLWDLQEARSVEPEAQASGEVEGGETGAEPAKGASTEPAANQPNKPGRRVGAPGHSRELSLPISDTLVHRPEACVRCGQVLEPEAFIAGTGLYVLDVESTATINHCIHEAGRAVEPIEEQLVEELQQASLAYADETPWKEWGQLLWLWVITTPSVCLYFIGYRSQEILANVFDEGFAGWLMSDGYCVYRQFRHRLRCWAHLQRKAKGLKDAFNGEARAFGKATDTLLAELIKAVYQAREGPPRDLTAQFQDRLNEFARLCEQHRDSAHEKTRALAREFLNDWEAIWIVLAHPHLPLTNNEAERALRHWVIARRISQGTRTEQGSRVVALLASVIDTCRKRNVLPWPYLARVVAERRKGNSAPPLPAAG